MPWEAIIQGHEILGDHGNKPHVKTMVHLGHLLLGALLLPNCFSYLAEYKLDLKPQPSHNLLLQK